ncbi:MAG: hypothetical protein QNJ47_25955 [Nostocaceae cyanobacterium]|nr:hypothetical protein [Nostocaceae cyanobacterium]
MLNKNHIVGLLAATLAMVPTTAFAQQVPISQQQQQLNQAGVSNNSGNILPGVAGTVVNSISGGNSGLAGVAETAVKAASGEPINITDVAGTAIKLLSPQRKQQNNVSQNPGNIQPQSQPGQSVGVQNPNPTQVQQQPNNQKFPYGCQANAQIQVSIESLNPLNAVTSGISSGIAQLTGKKSESPNQMKANGNMGC